MYDTDIEDVIEEYGLPDLPEPADDPDDGPATLVMPLTANDGRRNAAAEGDPLLLIGPDIIHYAELLMRFHDHRVLSPHYQFWGNLADYLNRIMHLPERPGRQNDSSWSEFNSAVAMAVGYIKMSEAPAEYKQDLLRRYFPPDHDQEMTR